MGVLRILLALAVVVAHSDSLFGIKLTGGVVAVEVFFMISGFYMSLILNRKYTGRGSYSLFLSNRALRLFPIYWLVLGLTIVGSLFVSDYGRLAPWIDNYQVMGIGAQGLAVFVNLALIGQDLLLFLGLDPHTGSLFFTKSFNATDPKLYTLLFAPQAWTLGIEIMFYLIAPFIVRRRISFIVALLCISLAIRIFTYVGLGLVDDPWTYRFFPSELALFLLGSISYRIYSRIKDVDLDRRILIGGSVAYLLLILLYQFLPEREFVGSQIQLWVVYFLTCAALPLLFKLTRSSRLDSHIGELSYPVYIAHLLVISVLAPLTAQFPVDGLGGELAAVTSLAFAYVLVRLVSSPVDAIRRARVEEAGA